MQLDRGETSRQGGPPAAKAPYHLNSIAPRLSPAPKPDYGQTLSYGGLAARLGQPKAVRATANANGANALSIIVPCHRIIGSDHSLTGYGGGTDTKKFLLELERE